jgi:hypothetical protein
MIGPDRHYQCLFLFKRMSVRDDRHNLLRRDARDTLADLHLAARGVVRPGAARACVKLLTAGGGASQGFDAPG